mmetsp:Transcript_5411/g.13126  ORF Transcript_5411/g.13126 Transcript_5411/m.13126 type:complete len:126 (-) Transcript_5411:1722-2099(-)
MASSELIWQCIRGGNSYMRKNKCGGVFSAESGNLAGKHSYKYSGIANAKNVGLKTVGNDIVLTKGKVKKGKKAVGVSSTVFKKDARKVMKGVSKEVSGYRSDLSDYAVRRVAALAKSVRVSNAKK